MTARLRVCVVTGGHWAAAKGGVPYQAHCLVNEMIRSADLDVFYLARSIDARYNAEGYSIVPIRGPRVLQRFGFFVDAPWLLRLLNKVKPDVIYQHGFQSYTGVCAFYAKKHRCRFVYHIASDYDVIPRSQHKVRFHVGLAKLERRIAEYGLRLADAVVAQTETQADLLMRNYARKAARVIHNFHAVPTEKILKNSATVKVVWVANFKALKRPDLFVRLAEDLRDLSNVEFIMIGAPGGEERYRELHAHIRTVRNLRYLGPRPIEEVNEILAGAHLFVNTSVLEGFANTFIQAWMRRVPVVTLGVNPEGLLTGEKLGICATTYEELRAATRRLVLDAALLKEMGAYAQQCALRDYSMQNARDLIAVLKGGSFPEIGKGEIPPREAEGEGINS